MSEPPEITTGDPWIDSYLTFRRAWLDGASESELADGTGGDVHPRRHPDHQSAQRATPSSGDGAVGARERSRSTVSAPARPERDPRRDVDGAPIPVVKQTGVDIELGALRSRLGKTG
ncbi:MAG TPA: hypothetical protein VIY28_00170, partial [Pseudonocardiaceae bacterium]